MTTRELKAEVLRLPMKARAKLASELLASLNEGPKADYTAEWAEEAQRRYKAFQEGRLTARPAEDVFRDAHARRQRRK